MPIRIRLAALAALGALLAVLLGGWVFVHVLRDSLHSSVDASLRTRADGLAQTVRDVTNGIDFQDQGSTRLLGAKESIAQIVDPRGRIVETSEAAGTTVLIRPSTLRAARRPTVFTETRLPEDSHTTRLLATTVVRNGRSWTVIVGSSLESADTAVSA
ncbi:MAG: hypothetical protein ABJC79_08450, partial [Acidimicrobiia bacterium]